tara:strand:+ start:201 stop:389 length:189 start_codon:yes stop_codon:yes gene_type:complete
MKSLEMNQMEQIEGGDCLAYAAGIGLIIFGGLTANPAAAYVGVAVGLNNAESCGATVGGWFS